jgi:adenine/guanine phosphoribosyltransferase-like PRPP-binding protein
LLLDSIIAAGGTYVAIIKELLSRGIRVENAVAFIERVELGGVECIEKDTGVKLKTLIRLPLNKGRPHME